MEKTKPQKTSYQNQKLGKGPVRMAHSASYPSPELIQDCSY